jgi:hypothetical protein
VELVNAKHFMRQRCYANMDVNNLRLDGQGRLALKHPKQGGSVEKVVRSIQARRLVVYAHARQDDKDRIKKMQSRGFSVTYYSGPSLDCFTGDCLVRLENGDERSAKCVQKGDRLWGGGTVVCVMKTMCPGRRAALVAFKGGLKVTPDHPIWDPLAYDWVPAARVLDHRKGPRGEPVARLLESCECEAVFSLVLDVEHVATVNGTDVACLGHPSWVGSGQKVADLRLDAGWSDGLVVVRGGAPALPGAVLTPPKAAPSRDVAGTEEEQGWELARTGRLPVELHLSLG